MTESLEDRIRRVTSERIEVVEYDPAWPSWYKAEKHRLHEVFPPEMILRIEHVGSTAVPGLAAKPIVDVLVGVEDLGPVRSDVAPVLEGLGYDYFWRPMRGDTEPPFYAWFIRRNDAGERTHHIHVVEMDFEHHWDMVVFRDYLIAHPEVAAEYGALKRRLARDFGNDRVRYTDEKTTFIVDVLCRAKGKPIE